MTTIHTRQLQQFTQDNYNNIHKTTTIIRTRQLQQYTQDNYNNTHKTTTTIHTRQQQYTQDNYNNTQRQLQQYTHSTTNTHKLKANPDSLFVTSGGHHVQHNLRNGNWHSLIRTKLFYKCNVTFIVLITKNIFDTNTRLLYVAPLCMIPFNVVWCEAQKIAAFWPSCFATVCQKIDWRLPLFCVLCFWLYCGV